MSYVAKIMGNDPQSLNITETSFRSWNIGVYTELAHKVLGGLRQTPVSRVVDRGPGYIVAQFLPGPCGNGGPTADIELNFINQKLDDLESRLGEGITDKLEKLEAQLAPEDYRTAAQELEDSYRALGEEYVELSKTKNYIIEQVLRNIAEIHVYGTDSIDKFKTCDGRLRLRTPATNQSYFKYPTFNTPFNEHGLDCLKNSYESLAFIIARELKQAGLISQGARGFRINRDMNPQLDAHLTLMLMVFHNLDDLVVDAGDNYPHHFLRNEVFCQVRKQKIEKQFQIDLDRILYRKRALGVLQFLCSPVLGLDFDQVESYLLRYQEFCSDNLKNLSASSQKKLAPIFGDPRRFMAEARLLVLYEAGFHGPGLGCRHEVQDFKSYEELNQREKAFPPIPFDFAEDGSVRRTRLELTHNPDEDGNSTFKYKDVYNNDTLLESYRRLATQAFLKIIGNPYMREFAKQLLPHDISAFNELHRILKKFEKYEIKGKKISIFNHEMIPDEKK